MKADGRKFTVSLPTLPLVLKEKRFLVQIGRVDSSSLKLGRDFSGRILSYLDLSRVSPWCDLELSRPGWRGKRGFGRIYSDVLDRCIGVKGSKSELGFSSRGSKSDQMGGAHKYFGEKIKPQMNADAHGF